LLVGVLASLFASLHIFGFCPGRKNTERYEQQESQKSQSHAFHLSPLGLEYIVVLMNGARGRKAIREVLSGILLSLHAGD
jgi:hypothetical protein